MPTDARSAYAAALHLCDTLLRMALTPGRLTEAQEHRERFRSVLHRVRGHVHDGTIKQFCERVEAALDDPGSADSLATRIALTHRVEDLQGALNDAWLAAGA